MASSSIRLSKSLWQSSHRQAISLSLGSSRQRVGVTRRLLHNTVEVRRIDQGPVRSVGARIFVDVPVQGYHTRRFQSLSTASNPPVLLQGDERSKAIATLQANHPPDSPFGWSEDITGRNAITKTYHFVDFVQAMQWMNQVADVAEMMQHHPEWSNIYNTVNVTLTTHDCGGVSQRDIDLATKMDELANEILPTSASKST